MTPLPVNDLSCPRRSLLLFEIFLSYIFRKCSKYCL